MANERSKLYADIDTKIKFENWLESVQNRDFSLIFLKNMFENQTFLYKFKGFSILNSTQKKSLNWLFYTV